MRATGWVERLVTWACIAFAIAAIVWALAGCAALNGTVSKPGAVASALLGVGTGAVLANPAGLLVATVAGAGVAVVGFWFSSPNAPIIVAPPPPAGFFQQVLDALVSFGWIVLIVAALLVAWRRGWLAAGFRAVKAWATPAPPSGPVPPEVKP